MKAIGLHHMLPLYYKVDYRLVHLVEDRFCLQGPLGGHLPLYLAVF